MEWVIVSKDNPLIVLKDTPVQKIEISNLTAAQSLKPTTLGKAWRAFDWNSAVSIKKFEYCLSDNLKQDTQ